MQFNFLLLNTTIQYTIFYSNRLEQTSRILPACVVMRIVRYIDPKFCLVGPVSDWNLIVCAIFVRIVCMFIFLKANTYVPQKQKAAATTPS